MYISTQLAPVLLDRGVKVSRVSQVLVNLKAPVNSRFIKDQCC